MGVGGGGEVTGRSHGLGDWMASPAAKVARQEELRGAERSVSDLGNVSVECGLDIPGDMTFRQLGMWIWRSGERSGLWVLLLIRPGGSIIYSDCCGHYVGEGGRAACPVCFPFNPNYLLT